MWLFMLFIAVPLIEIGLFIKVGGWLTLWPTLAIVLATGILGTLLVKRQGLRVIEELRGSLREARDPLSPLAHGAMILFAGALLLTPGFFTDAIGFLLLIPALRRGVIRAIAARITVVGAAGSAGPPPGHDRAGNGVIDVEYKDVTPPDGQEPSGWTRH
ncbi:MAG: FxsA family protein [Paracoccaceae bacterium]|nr:FxsA family protein [Paracoccaceae bacterium]